MPEALEGPLSQEERLRKSATLVKQGADEVRAAEAAEEELALRRRAAVGFETAFHGLIELADVLIEREGRRPPESHDQRVEALEDIGRPDLANVYTDAFQALHIGGYYGQRMGRLQLDRLRRVIETVERELRKLA
ncbi:MAG: hypothetical protein E6K18_01815 [Methanobacteriota archaeon]|nr:MAG: hypothetical protein E6K18_01815 [Euryarchaeota archaeon]